MNTIVGIMKDIAQKEAKASLTTELGIVTAVFPHKDQGDKDNYQCNVKLKNKKLPDGKEFELRKVPVATPYMGLVCIPNVGDLVLINFIGGNINAPVITGRLYNDEDLPPANKEKELLLQHSLKEGGSMKLDEEGKIIFTSKDEKNTITFENDQMSMVNEKFSITIDIKGEKISIYSEKDMEITAKTGKMSILADELNIKAEKEIKVESGKDMKIESGGELKVKSSKDIKTESDKEIKIKAGKDMKIESGKQIKIKAGKTVDIKGSKINANSSEMK